MVRATSLGVYIRSSLKIRNWIDENTLHTFSKVSCYRVNITKNKSKSCKYIKIGWILFGLNTLINSGICKT